MDSNVSILKGQDLAVRLASNGLNPQPQIETPISQKPSGFDWEPEVWERMISEMGELVRDASTRWEERRFTPKLDGDIRGLFDQPLPLQGAHWDDILQHLRQLIDCSGYNGHPRWFAYITSSPDPIGVLGAFLTAALNQNNNLWRIAPGATSIELQCINWFKAMFDLEDSWEGIFASGGQLANIIACAVARQHHCPWDIRQYGVAGPAQAGRLTLYTSDQAHYCHRQAAELLGLGSESLRVVPTDEHYRMRVDVLAEMIARDRHDGAIPLAVIATAGTVATGAIDPLEDLRILTQNEQMWLHVDGAYGLPAYLVPEIAPQLAAMRSADSLSFDPHKWLYSPLDAGVTLVRHPGALRKAFGFQVSYLDQNAGTQGSGVQGIRAEGAVDLVDFTLENSRPARATKVWLSLMAHGLEGFRSQISQDIQLTRYMARRIAETPGLVLQAEPTLSIVCWRVEPSCFLGDQTALNDLQLKVIELLEQRGIAFLSKAKLHGDKIALRACIVNFRTQIDDIETAVMASAMVGLELASQFDLDLPLEPLYGFQFDAAQ